MFAVIGAGLAAGRLRLASADDSAALNRFVFRFGFPAALFALMAGAGGMSPLDAKIALSYGAAAMAVMAAAYILARKIFRLAPQEAGAHAFASVIGNAVFLGLPIAIGIEGWARPFVTLMLVEGILVIGVGAAIMSPRDAAPTSALAGAIAFIKRPLTNPLVASALAGFAFAATGLALPSPLRAFLDLLARAAGPVALFSLGLFFATNRFPPLRETLGKSLSIALAKMALLPALTFAVTAIAGVNDPTYRGAMALFVVTPTAVGAFVMASQYGRYIDETAAAIATTTALSVLTIGAVLLLFA